jgi:transposase
MPRARRVLTAEFKAEIVELCLRGDRSVGQVSKDFDLTETAVRDWIRQAERDTGARQDGGLAGTDDWLAAQYRKTAEVIDAQVFAAQPVGPGAAARSWR